MSNNANYVSAGKPKIGGAIYRAPLGTALPTNAKDALDQAFEGVGYISDEGLTNQNNQDVSTVHAWGGDEVMSAVQNQSDRFVFTMIEAMNIVALKTVYGAKNVSGTLADGITIRKNSDLQDNFAWVCDMILNDNVLKRIVVPSAQVMEVGDIQYVDGEAIGYPTTIMAKPFTEWKTAAGAKDTDQGDTHREYMVQQAAAAGNG